MSSLGRKSAALTPEQGLDSGPTTAPIPSTTAGIHRSATGRGNAAAQDHLKDNASSAFAEASTGGGSAVPYRSEMESAFGRDFSGVDAHLGQSGPMDQLQANAAASGSTVAFSESSPSRELVAHELTHVVQQGQAPPLGGGSSAPASSGLQLDTRLSEPGDAHEREADRVARQVVGGGPAGGNIDVTPSGPAIQCGFWDSVGRGWDMYTGLSDEGAYFARTLMEWRILGFGMTFRGGPEWSVFMADRPEIQRAMASKFESLATRFAASGGEGSFSDTITGVRLNELESMRLTLHGCHEITISGDYEVTTDEAGDTVVILSDVEFHWIDAADLHPGTETELEDGSMVDDSEFTSAGWDYDIDIAFHMPGSSKWKVVGGSATHIEGWPPITGAHAGGFRG